MWLPNPNLFTSLEISASVCQYAYILNTAAYQRQKAGFLFKG